MEHSRNAIRDVSSKVLIRESTQCQVIIHFPYGSRPTILIMAFCLDFSKNLKQLLLIKNYWITEDITFSLKKEKMQY